MANIECNKCGDMVDVEARTVTLPFVCKWCEEDFQTPDSPQFIETEDEKELVRAQFEFDTELIEDLINQLEEANKQIEIKDARIRVLESEIIERLWEVLKK